MLLVTVAASALSGCMTVQHPHSPGPATAPSQQSGNDVRNGTPVVQPPAREALERVGSSRRPERSASPSHRAVPPTPPERTPPSDDRAGPAHVEPDGQAPPRRAAVGHPRVAESVKGASGRPNLCALGREYGGWRANSREAALCEETYGR